ncbi:MAG: DNA-directed RNA polymerase subunit N [archaeon]
MIIPVRCFACGKPIGHLWEDFMTKTENKKKNVKKTLDELGVERYCCRSMFMGHVDLLETVAEFKKY